MSALEELRALTNRAATNTEGQQPTGALEELQALVRKAQEPKVGWADRGYSFLGGGAGGLGNIAKGAGYASVKSGPTGATALSRDPWLKENYSVEEADEMLADGPIGKTVQNAAFGAGRYMDEVAANQMAKVKAQDWTTRTAAAGGSALGFYLPALAAQMTFGPGAAMFTGGLMESAGEAGSVYDDLVQKGMAAQDAERGADRTFMTNLGINAALEPLGIFSQFGGAGLKGRLFRAGSSALSEGLQEISQGVTSNAGVGSAQGSLMDYGRALVNDARTNAWSHVVEEGVPAAIIGALLGGVTPHRAAARDVGVAVNDLVGNTSVDEVRARMTAQQQASAPVDNNASAEQWNNLSQYEGSLAQPTTDWNQARPIQTQPIQDHVTAVPVAERPVGIPTTPVNDGATAVPILDEQINDPVSSTGDVVQALLTQAEVSSANAEVKQTLVNLGVAYNKAKAENNDLGIEMTGQKLEELMEQGGLEPKTRKALQQALEVLDLGGIEGTETDKGTIESAPAAEPQDVNLDKDLQGLSVEPKNVKDLARSDEDIASFQRSRPTFTSLVVARMKQKKAKEKGQVMLAQRMEQEAQAKENELERLALTRIHDLSTRGVTDLWGKPVSFDPGKGPWDDYVRHFLRGGKDGNNRWKSVDPRRFEALWLVDETVKDPVAVVEQGDGRTVYMGLYKMGDGASSAHKIVAEVENGRVVTAFVSGSAKNAETAIQTVREHAEKKNGRVLYIKKATNPIQDSSQRDMPFGHSGTSTGYSQRAQVPFQAHEVSQESDFLHQTGSRQESSALHRGSSSTGNSTLGSSGDFTVAQGAMEGNEGIGVDMMMKPAEKPHTYRDRLEAQPLPQLTPEQKTRQLEKLKAAKPIEIRGDEIAVGETPKDTRKNALKAGLALRGAYKNKDTGRSVAVSRQGIEEVLSHHGVDPAYVQSVAAIPQILEQGIYLDSLPNQDLTKRPDIAQFDYFVSGLNIAGESYTVKAVVAQTQDGHRFYDHSLSQIEKGELLSLPRLLTKEGGEKNSPFSKPYDKRLLQILQGQEQTPSQAEEGVDFSMAPTRGKAPKAKRVDISKAYADGKSEHGTVWRGLENNPDAAVELLLQQREGEVVGAMTDPDLGAIDFVTGLSGDPEKSYKGGFGFAHIVEKHGETAARRVPEIIKAGVKTVYNGRVTFTSKDGVVVVKPEWKDSPKNWVLTSYTPSNSVQDAQKATRSAQDSETGGQVGESFSSPNEGFSTRTIPPTTAEGNIEGIDFSTTSNVTQPSRDLWGGAPDQWNSPKQARKAKQKMKAEDFLESLGLERATEGATDEPSPDVAAMVRNGMVQFDESKLAPDDGKARPQQSLTRLRDVINALSNITPVRSGSRFKGTVQGYYTPDTGVARLRHKGDIQTALHEVGHALDYKLGLRESSGINSMNIAHELRELGKATSPPDSDGIYLRNEGVAEFIRTYALDPSKARKVAPQFTAVFEHALAEDNDAARAVRPLVADAFEAVRGYYGQSDTERLRANRMSRGEKVDVPLGSRLKQVAEDFRRHFDDSLRPLQRVQDMIYEAVKEHSPGALVQGKYLPDNMAPYHRARTTPGFQGRASRYIDALKKPLEKIGVEGYAKVVDYMTAAGALDYWANGMNPSIDMTPAAAGRIVRKASAETVSIVKQIKEAYDVAVDELMVDTGMFSEEAVSAWREKYPNYVPFLRVKEDGSTESRWGSGRNSFVDVGAPSSTKERKGGSDLAALPVYDPLESMVHNLIDFTRRSEQNAVGQAIVESSTLPGMGWLAERVAPEEASESAFTFKVWLAGEPVTFATDSQVYQALTELSRASDDMNVLTKVAAKGSEALKMGATRFNPGFWMINLARDAMYSSTTSQRTGLRAVPLANTFRGLVMQIGARAGNVEMQEKLARAVDAGLLYSGLTEAGIKSGKTGISSMLRHTVGGDSILQKVGNWYNSTIGQINESIEIAPKLAEFEYLTETMGKPDRQAAMESREVNLDFSRGGVTGKKFNRVTAFFNPAVQGVSKSLRTAATRPAATATKIVLFSMVPSLITWALGHDDEEYRRINRQTKDRFWVLKTGDTWVKFPKGELVGMAGSLLERVLDAAFEYDPEAFRGFGDSLLGALMPNQIPTVLVPALENWANKSTFSGRAIVPRSMENLPPEAQYDQYTSTVARKVGSVFGMSPMKVDNFIRGMTGGVGQYVTRAPDIFGLTDKKQTESQGWAEFPGIDRWFANPLRNSEPVDRFYDLLSQSRVAKARHEMALQNGERPRVKAEVYMAQQIESVAKELSSVRKRMAAIDASGRTPEEKRQLKDRGRLLMVQLTEQLMKRYYETEARERATR